MHPRNPYQHGLDFRRLADGYPKLLPFLIPIRGITGKFALDFKDVDAVRCLTQAILFVDFGLSIELPEDRLCPPIPNRLNYMLWIQDLVQAHSAAAPFIHPICGLDIGTGASAIYPLLGVKQETAWCFVASDIDPKSLEFARRNVENNGLSDTIKVLQTSAQGPIFDDAFAIHPRFSFTTCNPPFYASANEIAQSADEKVDEPSAVCTGAPVEMIVEGGESAFVCRMVVESLQWKERCYWFSSMLGKMSSVGEVVECLRQHSIDNYALTEFVQGQTRRWAVAWSYTDVRLPDAISRLSTPALHRCLPPRNSLRQRISRKACQPLEVALWDIISAMDGVVLTKAENPSSGIKVMAQKDTWSRAARRGRQGNVDIEALTGSPVLMLWVKLIGTDTDGSDEWLEFQYLKGSKRELFESFCSHVSRKMITQNGGV